MSRKNTIPNMLYSFKLITKVAWNNNIWWYYQNVATAFIVKVRLGERERNTDGMGRAYKWRREEKKLIKSYREQVQWKIIYRAFNHISTVRIIHECAIFLFNICNTVEQNESGTATAVDERWSAG